MRPSGTSRKKRRLVFFFVYTQHPSYLRLDLIYEPTLSLEKNSSSDQHLTSKMGVTLKTELSATKPVRRRLQERARRMRKLSAIALGIKRRIGDELFDFDTVKIAQRSVLRSQGRIPVNLLVALHRLYKNDSARANEMLSCSSLYNEPTSKTSTVMHGAIRALFEEKVSTPLQKPNPH